LKETQNTLLQKNIKGIISDTLLKEQLAVLDEEIWDIDKVLLQKEEKVNVENILEFISEFLLSPSTTWEKMSLDTKIKLQWFVFPEGVVFDGTKFRTTKISSLFKLKQFFLPEWSLTVHRPGIYYKHVKQATSPPLQNKEKVAWYNIVAELKQLAEILNPIEDLLPVSDLSPPLL